MSEWRKEHHFDGRLVMLGYGSIGQGVLPLLLRHIEMRPEQILIVKPSSLGDIIHSLPVLWELRRLYPEAYIDRKSVV